MIFFYLDGFEPFSNANLWSVQFEFIKISLDSVSSISLQFTFIQYAHCFLLSSFNTSLLNSIKILLHLSPVLPAKLF